MSVLRSVDSFLSVPSIQMPHYRHSEGGAAVEPRGSQELGPSPSVSKVFLGKRHPANESAQRQLPFTKSIHRFLTADSNTSGTFQVRQFGHRRPPDEVLRRIRLPFSRDRKYTRRVIDSACNTSPINCWEIHLPHPYLSLWYFRKRTDDFHYAEFIIPVSKYNPEVYGIQCTPSHIFSNGHLPCMDCTLDSTLSAMYSASHCQWSLSSDIFLCHGYQVRSF